MLSCPPEIARNHATKNRDDINVEKHFVRGKLKYVTYFTLKTCMLPTSYELLRSDYELITMSLVGKRPIN